MKRVFLIVLILPILMVPAMTLPPYAQADTPFIGEVRMFAGNFAPRGWVFCDGQLLSISQNTALFSILGTTYGGDGRTTFGLPDLRGRVAIGPRQGAGLTNRRLGEKVGQETVTLTAAEMPSHNHPLVGTTDSATTTLPDNNLPATPPGLLGTRIYADAPTNTTMHSDAISEISGGSQPHNNMQPYLGLNYIIAIQGIFPSRD